MVYGETYEIDLPPTHSVVLRDLKSDRNSSIKSGSTTSTSEIIELVKRGKCALAFIPNALKSLGLVLRTPSRDLDNLFIV